MDGDSGQGNYSVGRLGLVIVAFGQPTKVSFPVYLLPNDNVCRHFFRGDHFHLPCLIQPRNFALPLHVFARRLT